MLISLYSYISKRLCISIQRTDINEELVSQDKVKVIPKSTDCKSQL